MMDLAYASGETVTIQGFHASDDSLCNITATEKPQARRESRHTGRPAQSWGFLKNTGHCTFNENGCVSLQV